MSLVDLGKRLLEAAKQGHTEEVRTLMSNGAPFTTDWLGTSPLHFASLNGHLGTAEVLLRAGISRDARTKVDRTPLHVAAQEGHAHIVELLIRNGADIEAKDMLKMTPLHWAVEKGHIPVIEVLMASGSDTTCLNKFDKNSLDIAIGNGRSDIAEILQLSRNSTVEIGAEQQVLEEVAEVQPEITIQEEVDDNIISGEAADHFSAKDGNSASTDGGEDGENNTAVLATLAALAEATAPRTSTAASSSGNNDAETLKWLESHGIQMISADNSTLVASTLDTGQQLALTEAGKLALKSMGVVQQKDGEEQLVQEETLDGLRDQQVLTIMTGDGELVETSEEQGSMVVTLQPDGTLLQHDDGTGEPALKRIKTEDGTEVYISSGETELTEEQLQQLQEGQLQQVDEDELYQQQMTLKTEKE